MKFISVKDLPVAMRYYPGCLASPDGDGAILVSEEHVIHLKIQNGDYIYDFFPVQPSVPRKNAVTMFIPESMTNCWIQICLDIMIESFAIGNGK